MASRMMASCACQTGMNRSPCCSQRRDEPEMSVNSSVTTPEGSDDFDSLADLDIGGPRRVKTFDLPPTPSFIRRGSPRLSPLPQGGGVLASPLSRSVGEGAGVRAE